MTHIQLVWSLQVSLISTFEWPIYSLFIYFMHLEKEREREKERDCLIIIVLILTCFHVVFYHHHIVSLSYSYPLYLPRSFLLLSLLTFLMCLPSLSIILLSQSYLLNLSFILLFHFSLNLSRLLFLSLSFLKLINHLYCDLSIIFVHLPLTFNLYYTLIIPLSFLFNTLPEEAHDPEAFEIFMNIDINLF